MATIWITKYLTKGIIKVDGCSIGNEYAHRSAADSLRDQLNSRVKIGSVFLKLGRDAFVSEAEAREDIRRRIQYKLKALDKERTKLLEIQKQLNDPMV